MPRTKQQMTEQIIGKLREAEVEIAKLLASEQAAEQRDVTVQKYFRWREEYGGIRTDQAKRLQAFEKDNARLKHDCRLMRTRTSNSEGSGIG